MVYIFLTVISLCLLSLILIVWYTIKNGIPPMPTTRYLCEQTANVLRQYPHLRGRAIEAGSGWGTLALYLARRFPVLQVTGLENSPLPYWASVLLRLCFRHNNCSFTKTDMYRYDYHDAQLVICYLFAGAMRRFSPLWKQQLPDGAYVISIFFAMPDWTPIETIQCTDLYRTKIYVYQVRKKRIDSIV